ncbi:FabD/lysophospholipase-like protein [Diplogelasinospora grovesii]|uniref:FabD/lysophospholipase-like protein n=1 Tax=Diplogelasinospora grovesii TaxID=303347 RepID=A0AAN6MU40_9PEZI|nr:FabD/lysophospholipase-like protein [Diplogelasinospora grovesii]
MTTFVRPRILSLDGGGIRGISSLLILEDIIEKMRDAMGLDRVPRLCECFNMIGGTSTGGVIAIILGRLGISVDECIRAYRKVAQQAFTPKRTTILPADFCVQPECVARRAEMAFRDGSCTKTVVLAITKDNVDARPTLFRIYDTSAALYSYTIWEVVWATSAATTFFKPIRVGRDGIKFINAGFGYNNPYEVLFPERRLLQVLSIGTGLRDVVTIGNTRMSIITALKKMATSSKKGLQDITLSDWEKASKISAYTRNYLSDN